MPIPESQVDTHSLGRCLARFDGVRVIVLGDLMLDEFVWGTVRRISPEAPVPVVEVERQTYRPGGAANVAANIVALGGIPLTVGVVGNDDAGERLKALLLGANVNTEHLVGSSRRTSLKTRIIAHNQQVVRADREDRSSLDDELVDRVAAAFESAVSGARAPGALVVSDYAKGVINSRLLAHALPLAESLGIPVFLDPKTVHADAYRPITMITPNEREAGELSGVSIVNDESLRDAGNVLLDKFGCPYALVTRGEDGMTLFEADAAHQIPAAAREVFDVTGAGDTVIATLALAGASGASMLEAAWLANYAAGIAVGKVGTATVSPDEITQAFHAR